LGGALALGLAVGQDAGQRQGDAANPASNATLSPSSVTITPDVVDCTAFASPHECRATIVLRPSAAATVKSVKLSATVMDGDGAAVAVGVSTKCVTCAGDTVQIDSTPATVVRVVFTMPGDWRGFPKPRVGSGFVGVLTETGRFDGTPKRLRVLSPSPSYWQWVVVLVPLGLALIVAALVALLLKRDNLTLGAAMGSPSWKASESWSSNLTVGAGLANGVLALAVVSDFTVFMTKPSYAVLSMLLGSFVLLAPIVYGVARRRVSGPAPAVLNPPNPLVPEAATVNFEGPVWAFLLAGVLTLWASGGQLMTFALLIVELWRFSALSGPLAAIVAALVLLVVTGLLWQGATSMYAAASQAKPKVATDGAKREDVAPAVAPEWTLL